MSAPMLNLVATATAWPTTAAPAAGGPVAGATTAAGDAAGMGFAQWLATATLGADSAGAANLAAPLPANALVPSAIAAASTAPPAAAAPAASDGGSAPAVATITALASVTPADPLLADAAAPLASEAPLTLESGKAAGSTTTPAAPAAADPLRHWQQLAADATTMLAALPLAASAIDADLARVGTLSEWSDAAWVPEHEADEDSLVTDPALTAPAGWPAIVPPPAAPRLALPTAPTPTAPASTEGSVPTIADATTATVAHPAAASAPLAKAVATPSPSASSATRGERTGAAPGADAAPATAASRHGAGPAGDKLPITAADGAAATTSTASPTAAATLAAPVVTADKLAGEPRSEGRIGSLDTALEATRRDDSARTDSAPAHAAAAGVNPAPRGAAAEASFAQNLRAAFEASLSARVDSSSFAPALGVQLATLVKNGVPEARLHLNPAELGPIAVQIALDGSAAQVHMAADHALTRHALQEALPQLAGALRDAGFTLAGGGVSQQAPQQQPGTPQGEAGNGRAAGNAGLANGAAEGPNAAPLPPASARRVALGGVDLYA